MKPCPAKIFLGAPHSLLDDAFNVRKRIAISEVRKPTIPDDPVDLFLAFAQGIRVEEHACEERCDAVPALLTSSDGYHGILLCSLLSRIHLA